MRRDFMMSLLSQIDRLLESLEWTNRMTEAARASPDQECEARNRSARASLKATRPVGCRPLRGAGRVSTAATTKRTATPLRRRRAAKSGRAPENGVTSRAGTKEHAPHLRHGGRETARAVYPHDRSSQVSIEHRQELPLAAVVVDSRRSD